MEMTDKINLYVCNVKYDVGIMRKDMDTTARHHHKQILKVNRLFTFLSDPAK